MLKHICFLFLVGLFVAPAIPTVQSVAMAADGKPGVQKKSKKRRYKKAKSRRDTRNQSKKYRAKRKRRRTKKQIRSGKKKAWISNFTYGNHCGSGHVSKKAPIDMVDALCQRHDTCCKEKVVADVSVCQCHCDSALLKGARKVQKSAKKLKLTAKQRGALKTIMNVFSRYACYCKPQKICETAPKCGRKRGIVPVCTWGKKCTKTAINGRGGKCSKPICKTGKVCKKFMGKNFCRRGTKCDLRRRK